MKYRALKFILILSLLTLPSTVLAQDFKSVAGSVSDLILNIIIPLLGSLALALFFWGLIGYIFSAGDQKTLEDSRQRIAWGIVGLFFIGAIWGVVQFLGGALSIF